MSHGSACYRWIAVAAVLAAPWATETAAQYPAPLQPATTSTVYWPPVLVTGVPAHTAGIQAPNNGLPVAVVGPVAWAGNTMAAAASTQLIRPENELATWWQDALVAPIGPADRAMPMELERAVLQALTHSARVSILRDTASIGATAIPQAEATFDPITFLDTKFTDTSDPVGNTLTTGGSPRFIDRNWYSSAGIRKEMRSGAELEAAQRLGFQDTNSTFFTPKNQATAKLTVNITQPLLRGAGQAYNNGVVVLATVDAQVARAQYCAELQTYLLEFHNAFWDIYQQRAVLLQRRRLLEEAQAILRELEARRDVDVQISQLARARAAAGNREASLLRYEAAVKDSVARFKALVNDPFLDNPAIAELVPMDSSDAGYGEADLNACLTTALAHRPEIDAAFQEIRGATQRLDLAKNEVLPMLNLVIGSYVYGLQGETEFGTAYADQFETGRPTYWAGLLYERPIGNRAPKAARDRMVLELQRATSKLRVVTANVRAEVEIAVREITTTRGEMISRHQAMLAEQEQANYLLQRWRLLAGDQQVAGVMFNDLLDAQDRRAAAEFEFVTSKVAHRVAWVKLRRAMGTLCDCTAAMPEDMVAPLPALPAATNAPIDLGVPPAAAALPEVGPIDAGPMPPRLELAPGTPGPALPPAIVPLPLPAAEEIR